MQNYRDPIKYYRLTKNHEPECCSYDEMSDFFDSEERIVAQEAINSYFISTVFLCFHANYVDEKCYKFFETMVFDKNDYTICERQYRTYEAAKIGHQEIIEMARNDDFR